MLENKSIHLSDLLSERKNNFDFLRFVLACGVILSHSFKLTAVDAEPLELISHHQMFIGGVSLRYFFLISGFLITMSWFNSKGALDYLKKRCLRIYPGFIVAYLLTIFVFGLLGAADRGLYLHSIHPASLLAGILRLHKTPMLPAFLNNPVPYDLNGSLWTIAIEFECYLLVMALGVTGLLRFRPVVMILFLISWGVAVSLKYKLPGIYPALSHLPGSVTDKVDLVAPFVAGMVIYMYREHIVHSPWIFLSCVIIWSVSALETGFVALAPLCGAYILFYIAFSSSLKLQSWGKRMDLSYGVYLYGWPIQQLVVYYFGAHINPWLVTLFSIPSACLLAAASWFLVEKPFLKLKGRRKGYA